MKYLKFILLTILLLACNQSEPPAQTMLAPEVNNSAKAGELKVSSEYNKLSDQEAHVIINKGTEAPWSGEYVSSKGAGSYICRRCNAKLYTSKDKFDSDCGWPSFDDEIDGAVTRIDDSDGRRTEIVCSNCGGHLGHVFLGEQLTTKDTRHCVNSLSIKFIPETEKAADAIAPPRQAYAIFASGCFWGTEYWMQKIPGVLSTSVGYIGGSVKNPTYEQVCSGTTGHYEAVKVVYNPDKTDFETVCKMYFDTHNPEQADGQGNDRGSQYLPAIFYADDAQKATAEKLLQYLRDKGLKPATELKQATIFYDGEGYHQDYYLKNGKTPYCHFKKPLFDDEKKKK